MLEVQQQGTSGAALDEVPTALRPPSPKMISPSQRPGPARSLAPAGRSAMFTIPGSRPPVTLAARAAVALSAAQASGQFTTQFTTALDEQPLIDGLVAHPHLRLVGVVQSQPFADLQW